MPSRWMRSLAMQLAVRVIRASSRSRPYTYLLRAMKRHAIAQDMITFAQSPVRATRAHRFSRPYTCCQ